MDVEYITVNIRELLKSSAKSFLAIECVEGKEFEFYRILEFLDKNNIQRFESSDNVILINFSDGIDHRNKLMKIISGNLKLKEYIFPDHTCSPIKVLLTNFYDPTSLRGKYCYDESFESSIDLGSNNIRSEVIESIILSGTRRLWKNMDSINAIRRLIEFYTCNHKVMKFLKEKGD